MCNDPLTVGGGVSIEKISARAWLRSNRYVPASSQIADQRSSSPAERWFVGDRAMRTIVGGTPSAAPLIDEACRAGLQSSAREQ